MNKQDTIPFRSIPPRCGWLELKDNGDWAVVWRHGNPSRDANDREQCLCIESEISALENLLMDYPIENAIDLASLLSRLQTAKGLLATLNHGFAPREELKGDVQRLIRTNAPLVGSLIIS